MDSTQALIRFWRLLLPELPGQDDHAGRVHVDLLRSVLEEELAPNIEGLADGTVEGVLREYLQPDADGFVSFLQYWEGMESIMSATGTWRNRLSAEQTQINDGFRIFRLLILEWLTHLPARVIIVSEIRWFIDSAIINVVGEAGSAYWRSRADALPPDDVVVTEEEVTAAVLEWLEDEMLPATPRVSREFSRSSSLASDDSLYEGCVMQSSVQEDWASSMQGASALSPLSFDLVGSPQAAGIPTRPEWPRGPPPSRTVQATRRRRWSRTSQSAS